MTEWHEGYEPPRVEDVPAEDGPAVTAAGGTGSADTNTTGAEWRPGEDAGGDA
jgi:hypothetical protein